MLHMKNHKINLPDKSNAVQSGFLLKKFLLAFFCICQVSQIQVSHDEEKLVMEVWVSSCVLISYTSITPLSWNTAEIEWKDSVFASCLSCSFSTHFSQAQFAWRKASSCPSPPLSWLYWQTEHIQAQNSIFSTRRKVPLSGETEFWYELVALPEKLLHALYDSRDSGSAGQESLNSTSDRETTLQYAQSLVSLDQIWLCTKQELVKLVTPHHGASLSCQLCDLCHASPFTQTQLIQTTSKKSQIRKLLFLTCWPQKSCL